MDECYDNDEQRAHCRRHTDIMTVPTITLAIAGGTGSGKTTLADRLFKELGGDENVTVLNHDYYYRDISHLPVDLRRTLITPSL
jgi:uridine kinase